MDKIEGYVLRLKQIGEYEIAAELERLAKYVEELKIAHRTEYCEDADYDCKMLGEAKRRIEQLEAAQIKWISVKDGQPEAIKAVLACDLDEKPVPLVKESFVDFEGRWRSVRWWDNYIPKVTHWAKLPEAPGEYE